MTLAVFAACIALFVGCLVAFVVPEMRRLARRRAATESQTPEARSSRRRAAASSLMITCAGAAFQLAVIRFQRSADHGRVMGAWYVPFLDGYAVLVIAGVVSAIVGYVRLVRRERASAISAGEPDPGSANYASAFRDLWTRAVGELTTRHPLPAIFVASASIGAAWLACNWSGVSAVVLVSSVVASAVAAVLLVLLKRRLWPAPTMPARHAWAAMSLAALTGTAAGVYACFVASVFGVVYCSWS